MTARIENSFDILLLAAFDKQRLRQIIAGYNIDLVYHISKLFRKERITIKNFTDNNLFIEYTKDVDNIYLISFNKTLDGMIFLEIQTIGILVKEEQEHRVAKEIIHRLSYSSVA